MIEIQQKMMFTFTSMVAGTTYNFQIFADSQDAARKQLAHALRTIVEELDAAKSTSKAN